MEVSQHIAVIAAFVAGLSCMFLIRLAWSFVLGAAQLAIFLGIILWGAHLVVPEFSKDDLLNSATSSYSWAQKNFYLADELIRHFRDDKKLVSFETDAPGFKSNTLEKDDKKIQLTRVSDSALRR